MLQRSQQPFRLNFGMTLPEVLMAASIALILLFVGMTSISVTQRTSQLANENIRMAESARIFFDLLEKDLKQAYPHTNIPSKAALVPVVTTAGVDTDVLQCYTRVDTIESTQSECWVRYFAIRKNSIGKNVFRLRREYFNSITSTYSNDVDDIDDVAGTSTLLEGVYNVKFLYRKWDPEHKEFTPKLTETIDYTGNKSDCTHILVRLIMNSQQSNLSKSKGEPDIRRVFTKVIPIPESFTN